MRSLDGIVIEQDQRHDSTMRLAREFLGEAVKWGKHVSQPFDAVSLKDVLLAYEWEIKNARAEGLADLEAQRKEHLKEVAVLTGKIGGLQNKLNKQSA